MVKNISEIDAFAMYRKDVLCSDGQCDRPLYFLLDTVCYSTGSSHSLEPLPCISFVSGGPHTMQFLQVQLSCLIDCADPSV